MFSIVLQNGSKRLSSYALVDSGADHCVFLFSFMEQVGVLPQACQTVTIAGVGSSSVLAYFTEITVALPGAAQFPVFAGFTQGMDELGFGLLGQIGFFDRFKVTFDYRNKVFSFES